eukprot:UN01241
MDLLGRGSGLVAIIGDEDTVAGFMLAGIGQRDKSNGTNFLIVDNEKTPVSKVIEFFKNLTQRPDISLILVSQTVAEQIRSTLDQYNEPMPTVLEIPSKENPYDGNKDPLMQRINKMLGQAD